MKSIAILGSNGFLGTALTNSFQNEKWKVYELNRSFREREGEHRYRVDLFDERTHLKFLQDIQPDVVISAAWETEHGKFWGKESNYHYEESTLKFAENCFQNGVETFVGLGTMSEYGFSPGLCNSIVTPLQTPDIYSTTKVQTGLQLEALGKSHDKKTHWFRIFQAFGPGEKPERFLPGLISSLRAGEAFKIQTPNYVLDWIHTADIADAIRFSINNDLAHFVDIGTGVPTSVGEISELACKALGLDSGLLDYSSQVSGHERTIVVDPTSELLAKGWAPLQPLEVRVKSLR